MPLTESHLDQGGDEMVIKYEQWARTVHAIDSEAMQTYESTYGWRIPLVLPNSRTPGTWPPKGIVILRFSTRAGRQEFREVVRRFTPVQVLHFVKRPDEYRELVKGLDRSSGSGPFEQDSNRKPSIAYEDLFRPQTSRTGASHPSATLSNMGAEVVGPNSQPDQQETPRPSPEEMDIYQQDLARALAIVQHMPTNTPAQREVRLEAIRNNYTRAILKAIQKKMPDEDFRKYDMAMRYFFRGAIEHEPWAEIVFPLLDKHNANGLHNHYVQAFYQMAKGI